MGTRTVSRPSKPKPSPHSIADRLLQWVKIRDEMKFMKNRQDQLRDQLMSVVEVEGEPDEKGSLWLDLPEPVEHDGKTYSQLKRERRVGTVFLEDEAEKLLEEKGLLAEAQKTIVVLDHDEVYRLHQEGKISDEEIDAMFKENVTYAFKPLAG